MRVVLIGSLVSLGLYVLEGDRNLLENFIILYTF